MIETTAIPIGTTARKEAKTKVSTTSAPDPAEHRLEQHPGAVAAGAESSARASKPVRCTGAPPTVTPLSARPAAFSAFAFSPNCASGSAGG